MSKPKDPLPSPSHLFPHLQFPPSTLSPSLDPFTITTTTGFLPLYHPPTTLPAIFQPLTSLLDRLPVITSTGAPGLLATYTLGATVQSSLPDLTSEIDKLLTSDDELDLATVTAVFRDYAFLASAYLLEPCWETWSKDNSAGYGVGREVLPHAIAGPLYRCAEMCVLHFCDSLLISQADMYVRNRLEIPPFMSYAAAYSLYNYTLADPARGLEYDNLRLIRAFEKGLDPKSSEAGFVLTHVDMVKESSALVGGAVKVLDAVQAGRDSRDDVNEGFREILTGMEKVERCMEGTSS